MKLNTFHMFTVQTDLFVLNFQQFVTFNCFFKICHTQFYTTKLLINERQ